MAEKIGRGDKGDSRAPYPGAAGCHEGLMKEG